MGAIGTYYVLSITAPIKQSRSEEVGETLINNVFSKYCIPDYMIMDLDSAFYVLTNELFVQEIRNKDKDSSAI